MSKPAYVRICEMGCGDSGWGDGGWRGKQATTTCVVDGKVRSLCEECARYAPGVWAVPPDDVWSTPIDRRATDGTR